MVYVKVIGLGPAKTVQVDNNSYDGNIHNFIEKIYKKALPNLTKEKLKKLKGKFALSSKPGQILSMGIDQKKMSKDKIKSIIDNSVSLTLNYAPLPTQGKDAAFVQGIIKVKSKSKSKSRSKSKSKSKSKSDSLRTKKLKKEFLDGIKSNSSSSKKGGKKKKTKKKKKRKRINQK
tara:strand:+ start:1145 stop:1669 length:525 start_codon:yes stop_codon:yes gene_type:complete